MLSVIQNVVKTLKLVYDPLVMIYHETEGRTIGKHTVFHDGWNYTTFDPPSVRLDSPFKQYF